MAFQREIKELTEQLCQKENFVKELVSSRDILHQQLDDQTIRLEDFKKRLLAAENKRQAYRATHENCLIWHYMPFF